MRLLTTIDCSEYGLARIGYFVQYKSNKKNPHFKINFIFRSKTQWPAFRYILSFLRHVWSQWPQQSSLTQFASFVGNFYYLLSAKKKLKSRKKCFSRISLFNLLSSSVFFLVSRLPHDIVAPRSIQDIPEKLLMSGCFLPGKRRSFFALLGLNDRIRMMNEWISRGQTKRVFLVLRFLIFVRELGIIITQLQIVFRFFDFICWLNKGQWSFEDLAHRESRFSVRLETGGIFVSLNSIGDYGASIGRIYWPGVFRVERWRLALLCCKMYAGWIENEAWSLSLQFTTCAESRGDEIGETGVRNAQGSGRKLPFIVFWETRDKFSCKFVSCTSKCFRVCYNWFEIYIWKKSKKKLNNENYISNLLDFLRKKNFWLSFRIFSFV